jgi:hypothetical protein
MASRPIPTDEEGLYRYLKRQRQAIEENVLPAAELGPIRDAIIRVLDENLPKDSLNFLRFQKLKAEMKSHIIWADEKTGYPKPSGVAFLMPWINFFEKHLGEKVVKRRLEDADLWVESRVQGEDVHLFVGDKRDPSSKAHLVTDGETGEIRVDPKDQSPHDLLPHVETILTTKSGRRIRSTRDALEFIDQEPA